MGGVIARTAGTAGLSLLVARALRRGPLSVDTRSLGIDALLAMLKPLPDKVLSLRPVNPAVGDVKFEGPAALDPPPDPAALASATPLKPARKPRAKQGSTPDIDLFTTNGRGLAR